MLGCYRDCKLVLSSKLIGLNHGSKVKRIISSHLQRSWGFFLIVLVFKGFQLSDVASKSLSEDLEGLHMWLRIQRHQEAPISNVIWRLVVWLHNNWRTRVVSRNSCNHIVIKHSYCSGSPWWIRFSPRRVDVAWSEDERKNYYKNFCVVLSSLSSLILIIVYA